MNNEYASLETPRLIDATGVSALFGKPATWFNRDRVRKALYDRGFPKAVIRGRWSRSAVDAWLAKEGNRRQFSV
jgi:predicted DNA-binding transcriptional regulator AlpA